MQLTVVCVSGRCYLAICCTKTQVISQCSLRKMLPLRVYVEFGGETLQKDGMRHLLVKVSSPAVTRQHCDGGQICEWPMAHEPFFEGFVQFPNQLAYM